MPHWCSFLRKKISKVRKYVLLIHFVLLKLTVLNCTSPGQVYETNATTNCQILPIEFQTNGSIKTSGCVALFESSNCSLSTARIQRQQLNGSITKHKYTSDDSNAITKSFRDCTNLEKGPEINLDYYGEENYKGHVQELRDVCSCVNLHQSGNRWNSFNPYGSCLKFYESENCDGYGFTFEELTVSFSAYRSVKPCVIPDHCGLK